MKNLRQNDVITIENQIFENQIPFLPNFVQDKLYKLFSLDDFVGQKMKYIKYNFPDISQENCISKML